MGSGALTHSSAWLAPTALQFSTDCQNSLEADAQFALTFQVRKQGVHERLHCSTLAAAVGAKCGRGAGRTIHCFCFLALQRVAKSLALRKSRRVLSDAAADEAEAVSWLLSRLCRLRSAPLLSLPCQVVLLPLAMWPPWRLHGQASDCAAFASGAAQTRPSRPLTPTSHQVTMRLLM